MGKMRKIYILLLFIFVGCAALTPHILQQKTIKIELGQSMTDVQTILGTPQNRQFSGRNEAWQYCETSYGPAGDDYVIVWFFDSKVTGITTYKNYETGFCESFFRTIQWEDAPNNVIEHRIR